MSHPATSGGLLFAGEGFYPDAPPAMGGLVVGVSVGAVLQMLEMERRSCRVRVESASGVGTLDLVDGTLIHAATGRLSGDKAACKIFSWTLPKIAIGEPPPPPKRTVRRSLTHLLLESVRREDETTKRRPPRDGAWSVPADLGSDDVVATNPRAWSPASLVDLAAALAELLLLDGVHFAAVIDLERSTNVVSAGVLPGLDAATAGSRIAEIGQATRTALAAFGVGAQLDDFRFGFDGCDGLVRPLRVEPDLVWLLVADRARPDRERAGQLLDEIDHRFIVV